MALRVLLVGAVPGDVRRDLSLLEEKVELLEPRNPPSDPREIRALRPHLLVLGSGAPLSASALYDRSAGSDADEPVPSLAIEADPSADLVLPRDGSAREEVLRLARRLGRLRRGALEAAPGESSSRSRGARAQEGFLDRVEHEFSRAVRYRHPMSVVMLSIDGRERLVASYGEGAVEEFLGTLEETLLRCIRDVDLLYRLGGGEFAAILPETPACGARLPADRFLTQTSRLVYKPSAASARPILPFKATSSVGVADGPGQAITSAGELIASARATMGSARTAGGARVLVHGARA